MKVYIVTHKEPNEDMRIVFVLSSKEKAEDAVKMLAANPFKMSDPDFPGDYSIKEFKVIE